MLAFINIFDLIILIHLFFGTIILCIYWSTGKDLDTVDTDLKANHLRILKRWKLQGVRKKSLAKQWKKPKLFEIA